MMLIIEFDLKEEMMTFIDINILMIARNISFDKQNLLSTTN